MSIVSSTSQASYETLKRFLNRWPLSVVENMTISDYSNVGGNGSFTYWLEHGFEVIGTMVVGTSSRFGIWNRRQIGRGHLRYFLAHQGWSSNKYDSSIAFVKVE